MIWGMSSISGYLVLPLAHPRMLLISWCGSVCSSALMHLMEQMGEEWHLSVHFAWQALLLLTIQPSAEASLPLDGFPGVSLDCLGCNTPQSVQAQCPLHSMALAT